MEQKIPAIASELVSLYTKVEEQGRKKERVAVVTVCVISTDQTGKQTDAQQNARQWLSEFPTYLAKYEAGLNLQEQQGLLKKAEKAASAASSAVVSIEKSIAADQKKMAGRQEEIKRMQTKIKEYEEEIKSLQANIEKNTAKKAEAEAKASEANEGVKAVQAEVEKYRPLAE